MNARPVDPGRSRIVLVGTPVYQDPRLPDVPVISRNIADLAEVLTGPLGGFDPAHCTAAPPGAGLDEIGDLLAAAADEAEDLLLFYYSGHGLLSPQGSELYLSLSNTRPDRLPFTGLRFETVRDVFTGSSRAKVRAVILDSCFSGRAIGETLADDDGAMLGRLQVDGAYTLTSAPANGTALILPGEEHTAFTERLLRLLRDGSPGAGEMITLGDIYRHLHARLRADRLPTPQQCGTANAGQLGLVRNRALPRLPEVSAEVFQNEYLAADAGRADALVTVTTGGPDDPGTVAPRALVFLLGLSGELPQADFDAVTRTVAAAIDGLDDDVRFAVVAGSEYARMLYPDTMRTVRADASAKAGARAALAGLEPVRAAAFGRWIRMADRLFSSHPDAVRTAVLLMDQEATAESPDELEAALAACTGRFSCHVRGVGTNWSVSQGRAIATSLSGTLDIVPAPARPTPDRALAVGLATIIDRTRQAFVRDLAMRITVARSGVRVRSVTRTAPTIEDLTGRGYPVGPGATEYRINVPDNQSYDYHLVLDLPPGPVGVEFVAAELDIVLLPPAGDGQSLDRQPVKVHRIHDGPAPSSPVAPYPYADQQELARAIREGMEALHAEQQASADPWDT